MAFVQTRGYGQAAQMVNRYELTAGKLAQIRALLPGKLGDRGCIAEDTHHCLNGVRWVLPAVLTGTTRRASGAQELDRALSWQTEAAPENHHPA